MLNGFLNGLDLQLMALNCFNYFHFLFFLLLSYLNVDCSQHSPPNVGYGLHVVKSWNSGHHICNYSQILFPDFRRLIIKVCQ